jgi:hypothetical protein
MAVPLARTCTENAVDAMRAKTESALMDEGVAYSAGGAVLNSGRYCA